MTTVDPGKRGLGRDRADMVIELFGRTERISPARDEHRRDRDCRKVIDSKLVRFTRRVERV